MRYIGTEKVVCPACGFELDIPLYQVDGIDHYGMKFCHQCGRSLFIDYESVPFGAGFAKWLVEQFYSSWCDSHGCTGCPYSIDNNGFNTVCEKLSYEQLLSVTRTIHDNGE